MKLLMISHLLGDFYFQTDSMSEKKKTSPKYLLLHVIIYTLTIYCMVGLAVGKWQEYINPVIAIGVCHFIFDWAKNKIEKKYTNAGKSKIWIFAIDQMFHFIILGMFAQINSFETEFGRLSVLSIFSPESWKKMETIVIAALLCGKPAAILVALVFEQIPKTIHKAENVEENSLTVPAESMKIGFWVGILEREIILILGLMGQYGAIGFILTAKSIARHSQLNEPAFAEKYLVGTLLSAFIALLSIAMCNCI